MAETHRPLRGSEMVGAHRYPILIQRGLADVRAGRVVPHDKAMAEVYAVIPSDRGRKA